MPDKAKDVRDEKTGQFLPGHTGMGGRPKGSRNKLGEAFITALQEDFEEHGTAAIVEVRETKPADYLKVIASLMPKEFRIERVEDELTDEQFDAILGTIAGALEQRGIAGVSKPTHKSEGTA